jgi:hypothetical protein
LNDTDTDNSNKPVYYVSLKAKNGAGLWSNVKNSSPIIVVPEDVTGSFSLNIFHKSSTPTQVLATYVNHFESASWKQPLLRPYEETWSWPK